MIEDIRKKHEGRKDELKTMTTLACLYSTLTISEVDALFKALDEARELADRFRDASDIFAEYNIQLKQDLTTCRKELDAERRKVEKVEELMKRRLEENGPYDYMGLLLKKILTGEGK